jgi:hypothetical protein
MNRIGLFIWITAIGVSSPGAVELIAPGGEPGKGKGKVLNVRPRMTHEQLASLQRPRDPKLKGQTVRLSDLQQRNLREDSETSTKAAKSRESLVKRSTIVSGASSWTIVPRGSVLNTPSRFKTRVNGQRKGKLVSWRDFYAKNASWIRLLPVTLEQATGQNPLSEEYLESLKRAGLLVVAICQGGPISVRLPVEGEKPPKVFKSVKAADWKSPSRR